VIGQELHKIGWRDRKIPISKIGRTDWQNRTDSKNRNDFGFSCKRGVSSLNYLDVYGKLLLLDICGLGVDISLKT